MEGQNRQNTSLALEGNGSDFSQLSENQRYIVAAGRNGIHYVPHPLTQWIHSHPTSHDYVEFLAESGVSNIQAGTSYNSGMLSNFNPVDSSLYTDDQKVRYLRPHNDGATANNFTSAELNIRVQEQELSKCNAKASERHSRASIASPGFSAKPRNTASRQRATAADRRRRMRIAERLDALQELLPHAKECGQASLLDDIIDHIKYLQLQIKDQSQNRLGGESTSNPFIFLEGYGHYLIHEHMVNEPLEEMMGKLLEVNPMAAAQLLESRGLFMMPMSFAQGLHQPTS